MDLVLYQRPNCPYCIRVLDYIHKNGITIPMKDTRDHENVDELVAIGGKRQVPCLVIDGQPLYESLDIIRWLENNPL